MSNAIEVPVKLQVINYEDENSELGKFYTSTNERLSKKQAEEILQESNVEFKTIFQVRKEEVIIEITVDQLEEFKK